MRSEIILDANRQITGVRHAWTFDEFYSAMAVQGLDTNGDGVFSAEELKPLAEVNINSLKEFDYFTFVHIGDADNLPLKPPENYSLDYDKSLLTLHFTLAAREAARHARPGGSGRRLRSVLLRRLRLCHRSAGEIVGQPRSKAAPPRSRSLIPTSEEDAKALSEAFFSQLGPNSNFGSQFAQTVTVKCSDAPS